MSSPLLDALEGAPCIGLPVEVFFPEVGRGGKRTLAEQYRDAASICDSCPVMAECWQYVEGFERTAPKPLHGFAAGLRPEQREQLLRDAAA